MSTEDNFHYFCIWTFLKIIYLQVSFTNVNPKFYFLQFQYIWCVLLVRFTVFILFYCI